MVVLLSDTTISRSQSKENTPAGGVGGRHQGLVSPPFLVLLSIG